MRKLVLIVKAQNTIVYKKVFQIDNQSFHHQINGLEMIVSDREEHCAETDYDKMKSILVRVSESSFLNEEEKHVLNKALEKLK